MNITMGVNNTVVYTFMSQDGLDTSMYFKYNMGIDAGLFGAENAGYCLHGLNAIDLYV
jgi:hypothetical protein